MCTKATPPKEQMLIQILQMDAAIFSSILSIECTHPKHPHHHCKIVMMLLIIITLQNFCFEMI